MNDCPHRKKLKVKKGESESKCTTGNSYTGHYHYHPYYPPCCCCPCCPYRRRYKPHWQWYPPYVTYGPTTTWYAGTTHGTVNDYTTADWDADDGMWQAQWNYINT